jgi:AcrR family transcriptional regulator
MAVVRLSAPERREQLLGVARDVFARQGFHATAMNDVAEAAGVTKPVLYQHFASKRHLYLELLEDVGVRLVAAIDRATRSAAGPRQQVELGFAAYFRFVHDHHADFLLLFGSGSRRDEEFAAVTRRVEARIAAMIEGLIAADVDAQHRRALASGIVGMAEGASRRVGGDGTDFDPDRLARQLADLAWGGLRGVKRV